tara:strand:+ start:2238 stop:2456 length:219 start_codon:yes stop_codon:yes gene_type:complete
MKKNTNNTLEVSEYKIKFIYNNANNIHTRHFQSISLSQVKENLNKIIDDDQEWELISIEKYNKYSMKWEKAE